MLLARNDPVLRRPVHGQFHALLRAVEEIEIDPLLALHLPGVDDGEGQIVEMLGVARGQGGAVGENNAGNHGVAYFCGAACAFALGH